MSKNVNLTAHRNTVEKRRRKAFRDDLLHRVGAMCDANDPRAMAVVMIDANGDVLTAYDTGGIFPVWAFADIMRQALFADIEQNPPEEDFKAGIGAGAFQRVIK